ncbi:MAG: hypothetical protein KatS3mg003_2138 [Candidatus Nitrosocaldaceae archaeon]|nr:MAG: hypothetical protein KatS3mg003_2138 [Candidatus Nitrosocaldaceae archaeon]
MVVEVVKSGDGWLIKCSDSGNRGAGPARARGVGIMMYPKDVGDFIMAIDKASAGLSYAFTRSDGAVIRAYPSETKPGSIVIERSGGNWIRLDANDAAELRLALTRL